MESLPVQRARPVAPQVKNPPANAGDTRDAGLTPGSGRSFGEGNGTCSSVLAWKIPWTEEPGRLQSMGSQCRTRLSAHTCMHAS